MNGLSKKIVTFLLIAIRIIARFATVKGAFFILLHTNLNFVTEGSMHNGVLTLGAN